MEPKFVGGSSNSNYEGSSGVGGKLRKPLSRRSSTPYARPPTSTRNPSWLSKLFVDPASKLFNFGALRFFPNKALPPPPIPPPSVEEQERRNGLQETAPDVNINDGVKEPVGDVCGTSPSNTGSNGLPALEQLLKQKTFTRSEIDRLTELLKSRSLDLPVKDDRHGFKLNPSGHDSERHQEFPTILNVNKSESLGAHETVLDPTVTTKEQNMQPHLEDKIASPAELAKAYMSSRPAKVSPSALGLRAQMEREVSVPPSNSSYTLKSQLSSLSVKTSGYSGVLENGYTTPRSRGRSAIYSMARTPYSRFHPVMHQKVTGAKNYCDSRAPSSTSRSPLEKGRQVVLKPMALKRRSTVLDDDIGSIGPIRRIRQKHNLSHEKILTISGKCLCSDYTRSPNRMSNVDIRGASTSSASYAHVPRESSEMAAKILEHLEKMTPKEKSLESKLAAARERSNFKLTPHMLRGQALRSMEDLDESKFLQNSHTDNKLVDQPVNGLPEFHDLTTQKQGRVHEQGPVNSVLPEDTSTPDRIVHGSDNSNFGHGATLSFSSQPPDKKRPFKMSVHEDLIEMDDDCCKDHGPESAGKGLEEPIRDGKSALNEDKSLEKPTVSLESTHATPVLSRTRLEGGNVMAGEKTIGFNVATSFVPSTSSQKVPSQSTEVGDFPLLFSSGSATSKNNLTSLESKVEASSSLKNVFSDVGVPESDTGATKNSALNNTVNGNLGEPSSLAFNSMATNNILSVDAPSSNLASNGGPLTSSACLSLSSYGPASFNLANQSFTNTSSNKASSAGPTTSTSSLSDSDLVPANGSSSSFSERVSDNGFSKQIYSAPTTIRSIQTTDVKAEKVNGLGNFSNSSTVSTFSGTSTRSSLFVVGTSASSSAFNSQWPSSASGTSVSKDSFFTGSGSSNVSLSTPVHFGSSSSSTPLTSSSSFASSVPATKSECVTQSSGSAPISNSGISINSAAPVTFKFGGGASASSEGNAFGSTPTSSSTSLFSFNAGSSASSSAISSASTAPGIFSFGAGYSSSATSASTLPSGVFNFGSATLCSSSATSVSSTTSGVFNFGATTSGSSSSANALTSSSSTAPAIFSFGASAPASSLDSNNVSSSGPNSGTFASSLQAPRSSLVPPFTMPSSTGFSFGASSPAFGTSHSSMVFGSTNVVPANPAFSFSPVTLSAIPSASTQSVFGNSNDQMSAEDCMAEDPIQSFTPAAHVFDQSLVSPEMLVSPSPPGFTFGSTSSNPVAPFQFASQQGQVGQQNPSQFQASSSLEYNAGASFSLGSTDKSGRKIVKPSKNRNRRR